MHLFRLILIGLAAISLSACSSHKREIHVDNNPLTPIPEFNDPGDLVLMESVRGFLKDNGAPLYSEFEFTRTDLNADGRRDALVLLKNPYGFWCGGHGCTMLVMRANDDSFSLVNFVQPIRAPLKISNQTMNGWKTMIARVSGRTNEPKDVALMFDGQAIRRTPPPCPPSIPPCSRIAAYGYSLKKAGYQYFYCNTEAKDLTL
ncbi:MAG: hypothetical protein LRZ85_00050 [Alphaproteobacteria bacterium]|nr:hypothetical protein [Alphaproteobacteria bacterium]